MVGPISDEERERTMFKMKVGSVLLVGVSAGLITLQGDAPLEIVVGAVGIGLLVGLALVWYLFPDTESLSPASNREYRRK
jgi:4-amino-4-deoxy-L-arabinose transferase-like glycosyltransferase